MTDARTFVVQSVSTSAQPGSPSDGDAYLVGPSATGSDWAGQDGKIAYYDSSVGWYFAGPNVGDRLIEDSAAGISLLYTPGSATPSNTWVRNSQFLVTGGGSASSNLTTSYATLTEFSAPEKQDVIGSFGCFDWEGTSSGTMDLARDCYGPLKIRATFTVLQIAAGNLNSFSIKLQKDSGSGFVDVPGATVYGTTYSDTLMFGHTAPIIYSDDAASSGDAYRFQARAESDSATNLLRVDEMTVEMEERNP